MSVFAAITLLFNFILGRFQRQPTRTPYRGTPLYEGQSLALQPQLAALLGTNEAIILQKFHEWIEYNEWAQKRDHFIDGRWWTYDTYQGWQEKHFFYLSVSSVKRICKKLEDMGILLSGRHAKSSTDQTKWYSIDYQKLSIVLSNGVSKRVSSADQKSPSIGSKESHDSNRKASNNRSNYKKSNSNINTKRARDVDGDDLTADSGEEILTPERTAAPRFEETHHEASAPGNSSPSSAAPLPYEAQALYDKGLPLEVWGVYVAKYGEVACLKAADNALRNGHHPPGLFRDTLDKGQYQMQPPDASQKFDENYVADTPTDGDDVTETDPVPYIDPERAAQWRSAFAQLELQLDRPSFDTWLRDAHLVGFEDGVFVIGVRNKYAVDMLTYRMNRTVQRVLDDVVGAPVQMRFEVARMREPQTEEPLFKKLARQALD